MLCQFIMIQAEHMASNPQFVPVPKLYAKEFCLSQCSQCICAVHISVFHTATSVHVILSKLRNSQKDKSDCVCDYVSLCV